MHQGVGDQLVGDQFDLVGPLAGAPGAHGGADHVPGLGEGLGVARRHMLLEPSPGLRGVQAPAAQQKQRHVVVTAALLGHVDQPVGEFTDVVRAVGNQGRERLHAFVEVEAGLLHQAVGAQQQGVPRVEFEGAHRILQAPELGRQTERQPALHGHPPTGAVGLPYERVDVPGAHRLDHSGGQVGLGVQTGREPVGVQFVEEDGGAGHHRRGGVSLGGVGAQHDTELAHDGGGVGVMALDVADDRADAAAGQRDQVVPVAADVPAEGARGGAGPVADGDVGAGDAGDGARQHGLLEAGGQVLLLLVEHGPLQALRDAAAEGDQDIALLGGEAAPVAVEQAHGADRPGLGDQRQIGGRGDVQVGDVRPQDGIAVGELLR